MRAHAVHSNGCLPDCLWHHVAPICLLRTVSGMHGRALLPGATPMTTSPLAAHPAQATSRLLCGNPLRTLDVSYEQGYAA